MVGDLNEVAHYVVLIVIFYNNCRAVLRAVAEHCEFLTRKLEDRNRGGGIEIGKLLRQVHFEVVDHGDLCVCKEKFLTGMRFNEVAAALLKIKLLLLIILDILRIVVLRSLCVCYGGGVSDDVLNRK